MKVLFQSYHDFGRMYGGGPSVVHNLANELRQLGVEVTYHDYWTHNPRDFDLVHYFSCVDAHNWLRKHADDPPLVVTPITWYDFPWRQRFKDRLFRGLRLLKHRTHDRKRIGDPFAFPDHWFPNSEGEAYHFGRALDLPRSRMSIVPHGVPRRFAEGDATRFEEEFGLRDFVLCVGRFEHPRKNQLNLIRALRTESIPLVFIGGPDVSQTWYYDQCQREAGPHTRFLPPFPAGDPRLVSAYHACKVVVQPALLESPGLAGLEGALGGANVATTSGGSTREYYAEHAWYFDPRDVDAIRRAVCDAYQAPRTGAMRERTLALYTWDRIAVTQRDAYQAILQGRDPASTATDGARLSPKLDPRAAHR